MRLGRARFFVDLSPNRARLCCRNESYRNRVRARRAYTANGSRLEAADQPRVIAEQRKGDHRHGSQGRVGQADANQNPMSNVDPNAQQAGAGRS
jgi:hypothetical protein